MSCCHYQPTGDGLDTAFTVDASRITFGRGCLEELGDRARAHGMTRAALFSDAVVAGLEVFDTAQRSLRAALPTPTFRSNPRMNPSRKQRSSRHRPGRTVTSPSAAAL